MPFISVLKYLFPGITQSIYNKKDFQFKLNKPLIKESHNFNRPILDWKNLFKDIKKYGIRNAAQNTIAPTGAIATISGLEGYGCEPVFSLSYVMKTHEGADFDSGQDFKKLYYESQLFKDALKRAGISTKKQAEIFTKVRLTGSCQNINEIPLKIRKVFVVSGDLNAEDHVRMQASLQRFVDNSISKTINFPPSATIEDIKRAYLLAWNLKCKGLTAYVTGSREEVVLETGMKNSNTPYSTNVKNSQFQGKPLIKEIPKYKFQSVEEDPNLKSPGSFDLSADGSARLSSLSRGSKNPPPYQRGSASQVGGCRDDFTT